MGLSNAEPQKKWHDRQREKNLEIYRQKERERKSHDLLSAEKLEEKTKLRLKRNRQERSRRSEILISCLQQVHV